MPPTTLIRHGHVVNADADGLADVLIDGETIRAVGPDLPGSADRVLDASGLLVLPGGVDAHVHLGYPQGPHRVVSSDDWLTGTIAAACGGTTTVVDFVEAAPGETWRQAFERRRSEAAEAVVDFGLHMTFNRTDARSLAEIPETIAAGMPSFKIYLAYDGIRLTDRELLVALETLQRYGALPIVHAEDHEVIVHLVARQAALGHVEPRWHPFTRPVAGEADATTRALAFAEIIGTPLHVVHVSAARGLQALRAHQARGLAASGEVCPQHLLLTESLYDQPGLAPAKYLMAPPLRSAGDAAALWEGLQDGALDFVVTDHCPFTMAQRSGRRRTPEFRRRPEGVAAKAPETPWSADTPAFSRMPGGAPGIETRLPLVFHHGVNAGRLSLRQFVRVISAAAAQRFGLYPRKGVVSPGADADLVLFDPSREVVITADELHQNCDYTPYEGFRVKGWPRTVLCRGRIVVENGVFQGQPGQGRYLERRVRLQ